MSATAIVLAAGQGTRMKSSLPKTLHKLAGRSMLRHLLTSCETVFDRIVVVLGPGMESVRQEAAPHICVVQQDRLGTAHAALQAAEHFGDGQVAVLYADNPLIRPATLQRLLKSHAPLRLSLLAFRTADPGGYGRVIIGADGLVSRIVEAADASATERTVNLCNAGVLCGGSAEMLRWLRDVRNDNAKQEYYLTDVVSLARADGRSVVAVVAPAEELGGVNSRAELARAEAVLQSWLRDAAMEAGVTMVDPSSVFLSADTRLSADVTIEPNVFFGPGVTVAENVTISAISWRSRPRTSHPG
jgi:bifunctional UDP-N-acetylglucosamine pyrophosphorylase/glucosamine-1-phosphate N-acetyltransferase